MAKKNLNQDVVELPIILSENELLKLAEKFNSGGRFGNLKEIHAALLQYNRYLSGEIKKNEL